VSRKYPRSSPNALGSMRYIPGIRSWVAFMLVFPFRSRADPCLRLPALHALDQVLSVTRLAQWLGKLQDLLRGDPAVVESHFLWTGDLQALSLDNGLDEVAGGQHILWVTSVEPGNASPHAFQVQVTQLQVLLIQVRDFQLSPRRRRQRLGKLHRPLI